MGGAVEFAWSNREESSCSPEEQAQHTVRLGASIWETLWRWMDCCANMSPCLGKVLGNLSLHAT